MFGWYMEANMAAPMVNHLVFVKFQNKEERIFQRIEKHEKMHQEIFSTLFTGTQLLIVIIDATWNVNACHYEVSYASASSLRMRRSTSSVLGR